MLNTPQEFIQPDELSQIKIPIMGEDTSTSSANSSTHRFATPVHYNLEGEVVTTSVVPEEQHGNVLVSPSAATSNTAGIIKLEPPSPYHKIEAANRMANALVQLSKTRRDSPFMRMWDVVVLIVILAEYTRFTFEVSGMWSTNTATNTYWMTSGVTGLIMSTVLAADCIQHLFFLHPTDRKNVPRWRHTMNVLTAFPYDAVIIGLGEKNCSVVTRVVLRLIPATRVLTIPWMFPSESPDFVD
eukprot:PhF_6_TR6277/c0_g1_i2/m.9505